MRHITIDTAKCSGHGRCYTIAPELFEPDDEGFAVISTADVPDDDHARLAALSDAVDNCPERAISVTVQD